MLLASQKPVGKPSACEGDVGDVGCVGDVGEVVEVGVACVPLLPQPQRVASATVTSRSWIRARVIVKIRSYDFV